MKRRREVIALTYCKKFVETQVCLGPGVQLCWMPDPSIEVKGVAIRAAPEGLLT